jgi:N-acetylglucosamine-6-phosphate deacetylase
MPPSTITGRDPQTGRTLSLLVESGRIVRVDFSSEQTELYVSAGFIDLQVNGYCGFDVNADHLTQETIVALVDAMLARGVTCFAPTIITASEEKICRALDLIAATRRSHPRAASCIPFVHVEGPHISPHDGYRGVHAVEWVRPPSIDEFDRWQHACDGLAGLVTLSPHWPESPAYIAALCQRGVHVSIGHTHASPEQIQLAVEAGARLSTHLGNGIALEIARHRNPIWAQLGEDRLTATFIADGHHLPSDVLRSMVRAKGVEHSVLVSDSVALAGMAPGVYTTPVGGRVELLASGKLCVFGSELLAGSTASLAHCVSHLVNAAGVPLHQALAMATSNPGRFVGGRGQLSPGSRADLVRFRWDKEIMIEDVWLAGERIDLQSREVTQGVKP